MPESHRNTLTHLYQAFQSQDAGRHARLLARAVRAGAGDIGSAIRTHVLGDDWLDFAHASLTTHWEAQAGHLYVAANPMTPTFYKVGKTRKDPVQRMSALNNEAVVGQIICVQSWRVHDRHFLEAEAHRSLAHLARHKEFFVGSWADVCEPVARVIAQDVSLFADQGFSTFLKPE